MAPKKSARNKLKAKLVTGEKLPCAFCRKTIDEEVSFGKLYEIGDIQCHYFCVLLSSCLVQKGRDEDGLFGFLYEDILIEVERSKKHKCSFCGLEGATLGCSISQCKKQFHLPCGRDRQAVSLYYGNYKSFCHAHAPKQSIPPNIMAKVKLRTPGRKIRALRDNKECSNESSSNESEDCVCVICYEAVSGVPEPSTFWPPCCARDAWFHRSCLERMALSAGVHYLKCPLCNDKDVFREAVIRQGYYVPDRDAAWELEQNAFSDMYERVIACAAEECLCDMGRTHDTDTGPWDIRPCLLCGSCGVHAHCGGSQEPFVCRTCGPAAPQDLRALATSIEAVAAAEQRRVPRSRSGPVMPCRMSLRRTKGSLRSATTARQNFTVKIEKTENGISDSTSTNTVLSREELNLKPPTRPPSYNAPSASNQPVVLRYSPATIPSIKDTKSPIKDTPSVKPQSPVKEDDSVHTTYSHTSPKNRANSPLGEGKSPLKPSNSPLKDGHSSLIVGKITLNSPTKMVTLPFFGFKSPKIDNSPLKEGNSPTKFTTSPFFGFKCPKKEGSSPIKEGKSPFKIPYNVTKLISFPTKSPSKENCLYHTNSTLKDGCTRSPEKKLSPKRKRRHKSDDNGQKNGERDSKHKHVFKKKRMMSHILNNLFDDLLKEDTETINTRERQEKAEWSAKKEREDIGKGVIDLESFKSRYLDEVAPETHATNTTRQRTGKKPKRRSDIRVKIRWKKERLRVELRKGREKSREKAAPEEGKRSSKLKDIKRKKVKPRDNLVQTRLDSFFTAKPK